MGKVSDIFLDAAIYRRVLARWASAAQDARTADLNALRKQAKSARQLRSHLDRLIRVSEERLAFPIAGSEKIDAPHNADWRWRPEAWCTALPGRGLAGVQSEMAFGNDIAVFHDGTTTAVTLRQIRKQDEKDAARYGLSMEIFEFNGSFVSLVFDLPAAAVTNLRRDHILGVNLTLTQERPLDVYARLNIRHGPNTEQMVRSFPKDGARRGTDFDLAYGEFNDRHVEKAWIDLIFEKPRMNAVTLRDLTFNRRPRAQL